MDNKKKVRNLLLYLGIPILIIIITAAVLSTNKSTSPKTSELEQYFVQDMVDSFNIDYGSGQIEITLKEGMSPIKSTDSDSQSATTATQPATEQQETRSNSKKSKIVVKGQLADIQRFLDDIKPYYNPASTDEIPHNLTRATDNSILMEMIPTLIIMIILIVAWVLIMKKMGGGGLGGKEMSFGKAKIKNTNDEKRKTTFDDVAGADEEKEELAEVVEFLKAPEKYNKLGARIPKGVLLVGPPGTGKTLLARAVAGEAGVPFFSISGSDFVEMFVGVGASRVRDLFDQAKKNSPCIIFIDEIDAVGRQRGAGLGGGNDEREQTLNQLLVEMDGFGANEGVILIAATNRPDVLDPALMRPGRFDRQIYVNVPDVKGREEIFKVHSRNKPLASDINFKSLARLTPGFTGADIENILNESAILAARADRKIITMKDISEAVNKVMAGPAKKSRLITESDKRITAYHESGHAIVAKLMKHCDDVHEVSIIPRGMAAGYTITLPENDDNHMTKGKLLDDIAMMLGGRAAEEIVIQDISTGASNDIQRATQLARKMVTEWGMSDSIGNMYLGSSEEVFLGRDYQSHLNYSEEVAAKIDEEVKTIIDTQYQVALNILKSNRPIMDAMVKALYEKETIYEDEINALFGEESTGESLFSSKINRPEGENNSSQTEVKTDAKKDDEIGK